jgi:non-heme chloroperoxidase
VTRHTVAGGGGLALNVVEAGNPSGRPILLVHGWSQSHVVWRKQLTSPLADRFRLVAIDLRGHGESDKPAGVYGDSRLWADDVAAVIGSLGLERPLLVGWSYAGYVLCDYLRAHGVDALAGLAFVAAATDTPDVASDYTLFGAAWAGLLPGADGSLAGTVFSDDAEDAAIAMRSFVRRCFAGPLPLDEELLLLGANLLCPPRVRLELVRRTLDNDAALSGIRVPTLVAHGDADSVIDLEAGRHVAGTIPDAGLSVYEGCGHALFWEAADRFNRELGEFASAL